MLSQPLTVSSASASFGGSSSRTTTTLLLCLLLLAAALADIASAKRGCSAFGHSCYGGHGKRASIEDYFPHQLDYEATVQNSLDAGEKGDMAVEKPLRLRPISTGPSPDILPILRQWLMSYRRSSGPGFK